MSGNDNSNNGIISKVFDWAYNKALTGYVGADSAYQLGDNFLKEKGTLDKQVDKLIKWQLSKAAASGFLTGIGGFAFMPFSIPANVASVIYIQIRMISAIAYMGGHDLQSDQVKTMVMGAMVGNGAKEILKDMSIRTGEKLGTKLLAKVGSKSFGKAIPLIGGIIGGAFDAASTQVVGKVAKKIFIDKDDTDKEITTAEVEIVQIITTAD